PWRAPTPQTGACSALRCLDASPAETYSHSLHDALPISHEQDAVLLVQDRDPRRAPGRIDVQAGRGRRGGAFCDLEVGGHRRGTADRKSTRLNSSHVKSSYAVFCLKKKNRSIL